MPLYFWFKLILDKFNLWKDKYRKYIAGVCAIIGSPLIYELSSWLWYKLGVPPNIALNLVNIFIVALFTLPVYFLLKYIFNKWNLGKDRYRKYIAIVCAIIGSPIVFILLAGLFSLFNKGILHYFFMA